jgi:molybdate transport system permease protein
LRKFSPFHLFFFSLGILFFLFMISVLAGLFFFVAPQEIYSQLQDPKIFDALVITLETSVPVTFIVFLFGTPVAWLLSQFPFRGKIFLDSLLDVPVVLPPLVSGLALLLLFGQNGWLGAFLSQTLDFQIIFSKTGIIIAQTFIAAPFYIKAARAAFSSIPSHLISAAKTLGANDWEIFKTIVLPLSGKALIAGLILSWARALGEFGATAMVAGCIPGKTETMTVSVYMQTMSGSLSSAIALAIILLCFSLICLTLVKALTTKPEFITKRGSHA